MFPQKRSENGTSWMPCEVSPWHGNPSCLQYVTPALQIVALAMLVQSIPTVMKKTVNGWNCTATLIAPSTSKEFLNVDKAVPTTTDQMTSLDGPDPSPEHTVVEEKEKMEETPPQDAIMALSVLDTVESSSDTNENIMKAMAEVQDYESNVYKKGLKQSSSNSYLRNNDNKHQPKFDKCEHFLLAFSVLIVLHYIIDVYKINNKKISI
jgi:hypothetical protein